MDSEKEKKWAAEIERLESKLADQTTDLQRKNRQLEIEAALQRVRAEAMGMQSSNELADVGLVLFKQIEQTIGFRPESSWITLINANENTMEIWVTHNDKFVNSKVVSALDHGNFKQEIEAWKSGDESLQITLPKEDFIQIVKKHFGMIVKDRKEYTNFHVLNVRHKYGFLGIGSWSKILEENIKIYTRFAVVFEQTYTRFLDLHKAEKQAYESKVEASLEWVRAMAAVMNHSDDLMQIAETMFKEMEILKINPLRFGLGMIDGEKKEAELWASTVNDGHYLDMLGTLSLTWHPMLNQVLDAWDAQHDEVIYELKGKELSDYYEEIGKLNPDIPNLKDLQDPRNEITQFVSFFPFKSGVLYAFTHNEPGKDGKSILRRFANVFEQAHIRYKDLQIAEMQANLISEERDRLEIALRELRATQDQLVQQEKLASLGQLTAGIAHEIKNPLNFVNNFSEVSIEMIDEIREELAAVGTSRDLSLAVANSPHQTISEILDDIEANLRKIHEHGTRADSIVKSMLQHSRGGSGKMEPSPLNSIIKEYVNLAFHGMRAGKEPIDVDIDLQLDENIGDVLLIAEDFSRVILNVCNNAFDACAERSRSACAERSRSACAERSRSACAERSRSACAERSRSTTREKLMKSNTTVETQHAASLPGVEPNSKPSNYIPKLSIRTKSENDRITIEIEDNGPGIPDEIKDKILQPFFTTKKGTAGTGLGLSITNDIVKAHGGNLEIESGSGGSVFKIYLSQ